MAIGSGILGKFQQRIKNIRLRKYKKNKREEEEEKKFLDNKVEEIHSALEKNNRRIKKFGAKEVEGVIEQQENDVVKEGTVPPFIRVGVEEVNHQQKNKNDVVKEGTVPPFIRVGVEEVNHQQEDKNDVIKEENVSSSKRVGDHVKEDEVVDSTLMDKNVKNDKGVEIIDNHLDPKELLKKERDELLLKISHSFEEQLDELEVLESELYFLGCEEKDIILLNKVKKLKEKINQFILKMNKIIDYYNAFSKRYTFDGISDISDDLIVDDLEYYRFLINAVTDEKKFVSEYKKFDEFNHLYNRLCEIKGDVENLEDEVHSKEYDITLRDKKVTEIVDNVFQVSKINQNVSEEITKQNQYIDELMEKMNDIKSEEVTNYHLRGFGDLLHDSLRYLGTLILSPLRGSIPGIAVEALATRQVIGNLFHYLHIEEEHYTRYSATDYHQEINSMITNTQYVSSLLEDNLSNIERLKSDFLLQYNSKIPLHHDILKKIENMHHMIVRNQNKISKIEKGLVHSKEMNDEKMERVKKLNNH